MIQMRTPSLADLRRKLKAIRSEFGDIGLVAGGSLTEVIKDIEHLEASAKQEA